VIPGVVAFIAAFTMRFYPLDNARLTQIQSELLARKAVQP